MVVGDAAKMVCKVAVRCGRDVAARAAGRGIQRAGGAEDVGHCGEEQCGAVMD